MNFSFYVERFSYFIIFFQNTNPTTNKESAPTVTKPDLSIPNQPLDPATLDVQKKLLQKQRELLDLQQKKIELELLQTQVKLQEQLKSHNVNDIPNVTVRKVYLFSHHENIKLKKSASAYFLNMFCILEYTFEAGSGQIIE